MWDSMNDKQLIGGSSDDTSGGHELPELKGNSNLTLQLYVRVYILFTTWNEF